MVSLRKYQIEGIDLIKSKKNFGLFWQQRLGKTIVSIKSVEDYDKVIFAVPNNIILQWYHEIKNNTDINFVNILPKNRKKRFLTYEQFNKSSKMWIVASYDTLSLDYKYDPTILNEFDYIVLDEAHFLRNNKSIRAKQLNKIRLKAKYALALSGTPAVNSPIDLLRILKFINPESNFNKQSIYKKKYFSPVKDKSSNRIRWELLPERVNDWHRFISGLCDIKKLHDYLEWLPKNIEKSIILEMEPEQRLHYDKMLFESKRIIANAKKQKEKKENNTLTQIVRLQQICLDPIILDIDAPSIKVKWLEDFINNLLDEDDNEHIIVFTNFSSIYSKRKFNIDKKYTCNFLLKDQSEQERHKIISDFQAGKTKVLFTSIQLASLGLTLDTATCSIFLDKSWNPTSNEQASYRMVDTVIKTNNKPKLKINLICSNSIDEKVNQVLENKKDSTNFIYEIEKYLLDQ